MAAVMTSASEDSPDPPVAEPRPAEIGLVSLAEADSLAAELPPAEAAPPDPSVAEPVVAAEVAAV